MVGMARVPDVRWVIGDTESARKRTAKDAQERYLRRGIDLSSGRGLISGVTGSLFFLGFKVVYVLQKISNSPSLRSVRF